MAIHFPEPPRDVAVAALKSSPPGRRLPLHLLGELGGVTSLAAQPVFTTGLNAIVDGDGDVERVAEAPTSWRYAAELGGASHAFELTTEGRPGKAPVARVGDDRFTTAIRDALADAQGDPRVKADDFEARLLRVPALKLLAVWLHTIGTEDLFVPLGPTAVDAAPGRLYDANDFQSRLRDAASRTLLLYEQAERPDELGG